jgi:IS30 family transposase
MSRALPHPQRSARIVRSGINHRSNSKSQDVTKLLHNQVSGSRGEPRSEVGHFEGDLIIGEKGRSAILTLIDRASRFNLIGDLPVGHDATSVLACCIELIERVPVEARKTLTWDQGTEMARHDDLASAVGIDVFFAEPHSP